MRWVEPRTPGVEHAPDSRHCAAASSIRTALTACHRKLAAEIGVRAPSLYGHVGQQGRAPARGGQRPLMKPLTSAFRQPVDLASRPAHVARSDRSRLGTPPTVSVHRARPCPRVGVLRGLGLPCTAAGRCPVGPRATRTMIVASTKYPGHRARRGLVLQRVSRTTWHIYGTATRNLVDAPSCGNTRMRSTRTVFERALDIFPDGLAAL